MPYVHLHAMFALALVCLGAPAVAQDRDALIAAARREGSVSLYAGFPNAALHALMPKSFQDKYGVRVDILSLRSSELNERVRTEQAAGRFLGDILLQGESSTTLHIEAGHMEPIGPLENAARLLPDFAAADTRVPGFIGAYAIMTNTNVVRPADEPKSWADLLDPRWKGRLLLDDPRAAGGGGAFLQATLTLHGEDYHRRMALNALSFTRDPGASERRVAMGEYAIWAPAMVASISGLRGLPVRFIAPAEGAPSIRMDLTRLKRAPHPNAARLFIDHFLSEAFQAELARLGLLPVTRGASDALPPELAPFARVKLLGGMTPDTQEERLKFAAEVYK